MKDWKERLLNQLEPVLMQGDPRPAISAYHDMPYAIFRYPPEDEFTVRKETTLLRTRLEQAGKLVTSISLSECMSEALEAVGLDARHARRIGNDRRSRQDDRDCSPSPERASSD